MRERIMEGLRKAGQSVRNFDDAYASFMMASALGSEGFVHQCGRSSSSQLITRS